MARANCRAVLVTVRPTPEYLDSQEWAKGIVSTYLLPVLLLQQVYGG